MLHNNALTTEDIKGYEVCPSEPLHDLKGHISNMWIIIREFLTVPELEIFEEVHTAIFGDKDKHKGCDYRYSMFRDYQLPNEKCCFPLHISDKIFTFHYIIYGIE